MSTFLPRSKRLLISCLQLLSTVILEPKKRKSVTFSTFPPSICHEVMGPDAMLLVFWMLTHSKRRHTQSSLVCWKRVFAMTSAFSWQNSISLCPASFHIPRPNLPVTPGVSWLPTFTFQSPIMKRTSFLGVSSRRSYRSSKNSSTSASSAILLGA